MPALPSFLVRTGVVAALLPLIAACAPERDQFRPICPRIAFLKDTAELAVFGPGSSGRDQTALMFAGRMQGIQGTCKSGDTEAARLDLDVVWAEIVMTALAGSISFALLALPERVVTFWHPSYR